MDDKTIDFLEQAIPELADAAFTRAYWSALASGFSVLETEGEDLVEIYPDGTKKFIKKILPRVPVKKGEKIEL
ncbi:MAG TPA: hypothetical protein VJK48_03955 [Chlamydiales bacterium]|nr:hypothetical protein [Chlamydiales bacterium]